MLKFRIVFDQILEKFPQEVELYFDALEITQKYRERVDTVSLETQIKDQIEYLKKQHPLEFLRTLLERKPVEEAI